MTALDDLRAASAAAWGRDVVMGDYSKQVMAADAAYLPALEAEVDRLRGAECDLRERAESYGRDASVLRADGDKDAAVMYSTIAKELRAVADRFSA